MIGYVPQELALFHDTIRENIALSEPGISDGDIREALPGGCRRLHRLAAQGA